MESCIAKNIGKRNEAKYYKRYLHLGFGCSPEGRGDRWFAGAPRLTYCQVCEMVAASAKEPAYDSSMEDPKHQQWGKVVELIVVPKGDKGQPLYNHIYSDHTDFGVGSWLGQQRLRLRQHRSQQQQPKGLNPRQLLPPPEAQHHNHLGPRQQSNQTIKNLQPQAEGGPAMTGATQPQQ
eukprot:5168343-Karenia_brevis.AAC.1